MGGPWFAFTDGHCKNNSPVHPGHGIGPISPSNLTQPTINRNIFRCNYIVHRRIFKFGLKQGSQTKKDCEKDDGIKQFKRQIQGNIFFFVKQCVFVNKEPANLETVLQFQKATTYQMSASGPPRYLHFSSPHNTANTNHRNQQCIKDVPNRRF